MIPDCKLKYEINKIISPVELKKIKKEFLNFSKLKPPKSKDYFSLSFVEFLNSSIEREWLKYILYTHNKYKFYSF